MSNSTDDADARVVRQLSFFRTNTGELRGGRIFLGLIVLLMILVLLAMSIVFVPAGHKGIVVSGVDIGHQFDEGIQFKNPLSGVELVRYNTQQISETIQIRSSDQINMDCDITVRYHVAESKVSMLRVQNGRDWRDIVLVPVLRSVPRNIATKHNMTMLSIIERREVYEGLIQEQMTAMLAEKDIIVEDVLLRNIALPLTVDSAIEDKKASEQRILTALNTLLAEQYNAQQEVVRAGAEANATILLAAGQAEALRVLGNATGSFTNETMNYILSLRYIAMLKDPDCRVKFVIIPNDGIPIILDGSVIESGS